MPRKNARVIVQEAHGVGIIALHSKVTRNRLMRKFGIILSVKAGQYQSETEESTYAITIREYFITDAIK